MFERFKKWFNNSDNSLVEGLYADDYRSADKRMLIAQLYRQRFPLPAETPQTHPWKYDPLNPPIGWRYDPYYECWVKVSTKEK